MRKRNLKVDQENKRTNSPTCTIEVISSLLLCGYVLSAKKKQKFSGPVQVVVTSLFFCLERDLQAQKLDIFKFALPTAKGFPLIPLTSMFFFPEPFRCTSAFRRYSGKESSDNQPHQPGNSVSNRRWLRWAPVDMNWSPRRWTGGLTNKVAAGGGEEGFLPSCTRGPQEIDADKRNGNRCQVSTNNSQPRILCCTDLCC